MDAATRSATRSSRLGCRAQRGWTTIRFATGRVSSTVGGTTGSAVRGRDCPVREPGLATPTTMHSRCRVEPSQVASLPQPMHDADLGCAATARRGLSNVQTTGRQLFRGR
ncbi:hypothetical protein [Lentzea aerocolonigenes]|uniref:hypothetical protein n=1 Tax=Lentzea aerocolonigenes TaxID=68170 RepID=UPI000A8EDADD|nr:hypothetical protein [Lentzea aerocolonigenes]